MLRKKILFLSLITILLFSWNCSQQASIGAPPGSDEPSISFNYELTGAFESVVKSELSRAQAAFYKTKMKVTNLKNAQVTTYDWVVSLDKEAMKVTSYSSVALKNGTYNFEMLINAGDYQYYGQSGAVEIKDEANRINLTINPIVGNIISDTASTYKISELTILFSTEELAKIYYPRLGYSIDGSSETIININQKTGLSTIMANLSGGEHTIKLNLYSYTKLLGTTRPGPEERHNFSYSRQLSAKIYPIYGECTINPSLATANLTTVELTLPDELKVNDPREYLEVIFKVIDNKGIHKSSPLKVTTGSSGKLKASGNVEGLNGFDSPPYRVEVNVKKHLEFQTGPTSKVHQVSELARATSSATSNPQELEKLSLTYQIFTGNLVKAGLRSVLNLALYNSHGHPVKGYNINVDGKSALTGAGGQGPVNFDLEAGERLVELQFGKYGQVFKSFNLTLAPLEVKNLSFSLPPSKLWIETGRDSFNYGSPVPFELVEGGNKSYRVREQSSTIVVEMLNTGGTTWQQAASPYPLQSTENLLSKNGTSLDSQGRLSVAIVDESGLIKRVVRLKGDCSAWEELPSALGTNGYALISNSSGELHLIDRDNTHFIQKLKADETGWELPYPAAPALKDAIVLFDKKDRLHIMGKRVTGGRQFSLYRYDSTMKSWKNIESQLIFSSQPFRYDLAFDSKNRAIVLRDESKFFKDTATTGIKYYIYSLSISRYNEDGSYDSGKTITTIKEDPIELNGCTIHNDDIYVLANCADGQVKLYKVGAIELNVDSSFSEDIPVKGGDFGARLASTPAGRLYLNYYDKESGASVYYYRQ